MTSLHVKWWHEEVVGSDPLTATPADTGRPPVVPLPGCPQAAHPPSPRLHRPACCANAAVARAASPPYQVIHGGESVGSMGLPVQIDGVLLGG